METKSDYSRDVYAPQLEAAQEFQDFVCKALHARGIVLQNMSSQKYQQQGENLMGLEIKFDQRFWETGNLYIETDEKSHPDRPHYVRSDIYRTDNSWLYAIGDYHVLFIFAKNFLRGIDKAEPPWLRRFKPTGTSVGFGVPLRQGCKYADKVIAFTGKGSDLLAEQIHFE